MKKKMAILLFAAVALMLVACGHKAETVPVAPTQAQTQETQAPETQIAEVTEPEIYQPEYSGIYRRSWREEIGGTVVEMDSYIVLNEDYTGYWIAQDVGMLTWDESQLMLNIGETFDIARSQENGIENLLVYEFQDSDGAWIPTVFEKTDKLPAEMEEMLTKF